MGKDYLQGGLAFENFLAVQILEELLYDYSTCVYDSKQIILQYNKHINDTKTKFDDIVILGKVEQRFSVKHRSKHTNYTVANFFDDFIKEIIDIKEELRDEVEYNLVIGIDLNCKLDCSISSVLEGINQKNKYFEDTESFVIKDYIGSELEELVNNYYFANDTLDYAIDLSDINIHVIKTPIFNDDAIHYEVIERKYFHKKLVELSAADMSIETLYSILDDIRVNFDKFEYKSYIDEIYGIILRKCGLNKYDVNIDQNIPYNKKTYVSRNSEVFRIKKLLSQNNLIVISGSPGCGKTFLTEALKLSLEQDETKVIKYHLFLNKSDEFANDRLEKQIIFSSISKSIAHYFPGIVSRLEVDDAAIKTHLNTFDDEVVLIIDGIDHLNREIHASKYNVEDLIDFLLSISSDKVKVIVLTQPIDLNLTCGCAHHRLEGFNEEDAKEFLNKHNVEDTKVSKMLEMSSFNPLLLSMLVQDENININESLPKDLYDYYGMLLTDECKDIMKYVALSSVSLNLDEIRCIENLSQEALCSVYDKLKHTLIIVKYPFDSIIFFHESFKVFVLDILSSKVDSVDKLKLEIDNKVIEYYSSMDNLKKRVHFPVLLDKHRFYGQYDGKLDIFEHLYEMVDVFFSYNYVTPLYDSLTRIYTFKSEWEELYKVSYINEVYNLFLNSELQSLESILVYYFTFTRDDDFVDWFIESRNKYYENSIYGEREDEIKSSEFLAYCYFKKSGIDLENEINYILDNDDQLVDCVRSRDSSTKEIILEAALNLKISPFNNHDGNYYNFINCLKTFSKQGIRMSDNRFLEYNVDLVILNRLFKNKCTDLNELENWGLLFYDALVNKPASLTGIKNVIYEIPFYNQVMHILTYTNTIIPTAILKCDLRDDIILFLIDFFDCLEEKTFASLFISNTLNRVYNTITYNYYPLCADTIIILDEFVSNIMTSDSNSSYLQKEVMSLMQSEVYLNTRTSLTDLKHLFSYGSYRDNQILDLEVIADKYIENNNTNAYDKMYQLIYISSYAISIMDKSKDVRHLPQNIFRSYFDKNPNYAIIMAIELYLKSDGEVDLLNENYYAIIKYFEKIERDSYIKLLLIYLLFVKDYDCIFVEKALQIPGFDREKKYIVAEYIDTLIEDGSIRYSNNAERDKLKSLLEYIGEGTTYSFQDDSHSEGLKDTKEDMEYETKKDDEPLHLHFSNDILENFYSISKHYVSLSSSKTVRDIFFEKFTYQLILEDNCELLISNRPADRYLCIPYYPEYIMNNIVDINAEDNEKIRVLIFGFVLGIKFESFDYYELLDEALSINKKFALKTLKNFIVVKGEVPKQYFILKYLIPDNNYEFYNYVESLYIKRLPRLEKNFNSNINIQNISTLDTHSILLNTMSVMSLKIPYFTKSYNGYSTIRTIIQKKIMFANFEAFIKSHQILSDVLCYDYLSNQKYYEALQYLADDSTLFEASLLKNYVLKTNEYKYEYIIKIKNYRSGSPKVLKGAKELHKLGIEFADSFVLYGESDKINNYNVGIRFGGNVSTYNNKKDVEDNSIEELAFYITESQSKNF